MINLKLSSYEHQSHRPQFSKKILQPYKIVTFIDYIANVILLLLIQEPLLVFRDSWKFETLPSWMARFGPTEGKDILLNGSQ